MVRAQPFYKVDRAAPTAIAAVFAKLTAQVIKVWVTSPLKIII